ncbi:site-specific DNA-methyltransferase [Methylomonas koyamae]|uniref:site-specific DNA-methyltransferase n=1 Tax=Methylomonas koyamae TaxID=702114 RepID=UPI002873246D|nr:site-specific DNA-methyltransferase [Methylomonas koyamae]WNB74426.1 site-specific DNA-methyltransferase [Methylomonas koyamae]
MSKKQKLELTWIGKDKRPRLEPRILLEDAEKSYHAKFRRFPSPPAPLPAGEGSKSPSPQRGEGLGRGGQEDIFDNRLIFGDNLLALKALEQEFSGQVKCVFIDPPYNTGSSFTHYDDGLEHSIWLGLMRDRLEIIRRLLSDDGSLWISIDDNEAHYLKVMCDEVFGRSNFVANVVWQKKYSKQNDAKWLSTSHDHILIYAKIKDLWKPNQVKRTDDQLRGYKNLDNDPRGAWQSVVYTCAKTRSERPNLYYGIKHPKTNELIFPSESRVWAYDKKRHEEHVRENLIWWGELQEKDKPRLKSFLSKVGTGLVPDTLWLRDDSGDNQDAKREMLALNAEDIFATPKPERLIAKVLQIASNPNDLVLDSFAGSGTTGAVAHKMGRRWIMVELGEHCHTHIIPRLQKVIDGEDQGGISKAVNWQGGGGFRYYKLAPSLIVNDRWGNPVVNPDYNAAMLAEALCKLEGFVYAPSESRWWQHGHSSERDFIYVTTQNLSVEQLQALADEVGGALSLDPSPVHGRGEFEPLSQRGEGLGRGYSLLVCCSAFHGITAAQANERWPNLTLKKIPKMVLARCEWGHDDYSLNVANLPMAEVEPVPDTSKPARGKRRAVDPAQQSLFAEDEEA